MLTRLLRTFSLLLLFFCVVALPIAMPAPIAQPPRAFAANTLTWTTKASMPEARYEFGLVTGTNGKIYAVGGYNASNQHTSTLYEYDPTTNAWATKASMPTARVSLAVAAGCNGKIYAMGGEIPGTTRITTVEEYDPTTNTWATKASMPTARSRFSAVAASNCKIYAVGGITNGDGTLATVEEYDPTTNSWASKASMPTARSWLGVAASNGKVYAIGGRGPTNCTDCSLATVEEYNPSTNTWATKTSMPTARQQLGAVNASDNKVYAIGGFATTSNPFLATVEVFDPTTNTWATETSIQTARAYVGVAATTTGKLYAMGGGISGSVVSNVEETTIPAQTYSISGRVTLNNAGLSGVTISDGSGHTATTDSNGNYTISGLTSGNYTLTPSKSGYSFTPTTRSANLTQNVTGQDFVASAITPPDTTPPSISNVRRSTDSIYKQGCPSTLTMTLTIRADVSDSSGLAWVRLYYQPPGGSWAYSTIISVNLRALTGLYPHGAQGTSVRRTTPYGTARGTLSSLCPSLIGR